MSEKIPRKTETLQRRTRRMADDARVVALRELVQISTLSVAELRWIGRQAILRVFAAQTTIVTERMPSAYLYIVLQGTVSATLHDRIGREASLGTLSVGDVFGEGPLFGNHFASSTLVSQSPCQLLQIPLTQLQRDAHLIPGFLEQLRGIYRQRLVLATLLRVPFLAVMSDAERTAIAEQLLVREVRRGEFVIRRGNRPNGLHLIESGQFVVEHEGHVLSHLDAGDFFGATALMTNEPAHDDIRALTPCQILTMPTLQFLTLLDQHPDMADFLQTSISERNHYGAQLDTLGDALVRRGVRRGERILVRDVERCPPGCQLCLDGCASRHGVPRMQLTGIRTEAIQILDSCRQCRVGAECMEICPQHAIQWSGSVLTVGPSCDGCGLCVPACPYDALTVDPITPGLIATLQDHAQRIPIISLIVNKPPKKANKCDFCADFQDMACVSRCPIGALRIVDVEQLYPY
jgi:CRP-like cAMP-binding protein/Fe-S-cluster-containing hydrogenase component 2